MDNRFLQIFVVVGALLTAEAALAANETWVSSTGNDAGSCALTAPCRTFAFAAGKTNNGGTINVLTAGSYGPLTITKAVSIIADGVQAVIDTAGAGAAIRIQAGSNHVVVLRGLTIQGVAGNTGITFASGGGVQIQKTAINGGAIGINFAPSAGVPELSVSDTTIANASSVGLAVLPTGSGGARALIERVRVENSKSDGIQILSINSSGSINTTLRDCVSSGNAGTGIAAGAFASNPTQVMVDRCALSNNNIGIDSQGPGTTVRIGDSVVAGNGVGLNSGFGAVLASYGTNKVNGNGTDGAPTTTISPK